MPRIHFFPGSAPCGLIEMQHLSHETITQTFQIIKKAHADKSSGYRHFKDLLVYSANDHLRTSEFKSGDIIVAGSAGGILANKFIQQHNIKHPHIVAFEALGLDKYGQSVWHFISEQGKNFASKNHTPLYWDDQGTGHNSYMPHPDKDKLLEKSKDPIKVSELVADKGDKKLGHFYLYDQVIVLNSETGKKKILSHVLMRCNEVGELIIPKNRFDQASIIMDVVVNAAYARANNDIGLMPTGFTAHSTDLAVGPKISAMQLEPPKKRRLR